MADLVCLFRCNCKTGYELSTRHYYHIQEQRGKTELWLKSTGLRYGNDESEIVASENWLCHLHLQALFACSTATTKLAVNPRSARLYARTAKDSTVLIIPKQGLQSNWRTGCNWAACQRLCTWLVSSVCGRRPEIPTNSIQSSSARLSHLILAIWLVLLMHKIHYTRSP